MSPSMLDSRAALAAEIAESVRMQLRAKQDEMQLERAIEKSLLDEARRAELRLAYLRVGAAGVFSLFVFGRLLLSDLVRVSPPTVGSLGAALGWMTFSAAILMLLRRDWYRPWVRRAFPIADASLLLIGLGVSQVGTDAFTRPPGLASTFAALCIVLAFTGAFRLTRRAVEISTGLGAGALLIAAALGWVPLAAAGGSLVAIGLAGVLAFYVTEMIRRVVMNEVHRVTLDKMYGEAERIIDAREEILRIVAHDLRNPLNTISMAADLLLEDTKQEASRTSQLRIVKRSGERMNRLIQDLLSVTTIEAGRLSIAPKRTSVNDLLHEACELLEPIAREKSISLTVSAAADLPPVRADSSRVLQVFSNLVGNAVKFTPSGGAITMSAVRDDGKVICSVADNGPGIPSAQIPRLFGKFWQAKRGDGRGVGLGLAIARGIVEAHGGTITVDSEEGKGSVFSFPLQVWSNEMARMDTTQFTVQTRVTQPLHAPPA
ncbi:MAG TPA: ATP-binding protein [Gemmatimonadaceae bacterium]|nr:ATP-binding protein [Gemmatimonadaceae bacterium]